MGHVAHDAILVTVYVDLSGTFAGRVAEFRQSMSAEYQPLLVGPIPSVRNAHPTYLLAPDGSKEGWDASDVGDALRVGFMSMLHAAAIIDGTHLDVAMIHYGGDARDRAAADFIRIPTEEN